MPSSPFRRRVDDALVERLRRAAALFFSFRRPQPHPRTTPVDIFGEPAERVIWLGLIAVALCGDCVRLRARHLFYTFVYATLPPVSVSGWNSIWACRDFDCFLFRFWIVIALLLWIKMSLWDVLCRLRLMKTDIIGNDADMDHRNDHLPVPRKETATKVIKKRKLKRSFRIYVVYAQCSSSAS